VSHKGNELHNEYITLDNLVSVLQPICNELGLLITHKSVCIEENIRYVETIIFDLDDE